MVEVEVCEDLLDEIIARLPPKFILRFRCVSKSWCCRIDSSNFIRKQSIHSAARARRTANVAHQLHIENDVYRLLHGLKPEGPFLEIDSLNFPDACKVFDSCYGIFCLYKKSNIPTITLWNPSIRRKLDVPKVPYEFCLPYSVVFGFGYDPIADDYNIVGLSFGTTLQTLFLYSTNTNGWTEIDLPKSDPPIKLESLARFVDGVMHWVVVKHDSRNTNDYYILTFNLSSRVFGAIPLPNTTQGAIMLLIFKGYLTVILEDGMWLRKLDNNNVASWYKPFNINVPKAYNPFSGVSRTFVTSSNSCYKYEIDSYVETLALLDNKNCSSSKETTTMF